jgi:hypothetical protein
MTSFNITTPGALFQKLLDEQKDFEREHCLSARHALNAVMTAYHLHEWVWGAFIKKRRDVQAALQLPREKGPATIGSFLAWLKKQCPAMVDAQLITNGTKHYGSDIQTGTHKGAFQRSAFQANVFDVSYLWVERNGRKQRAEEFVGELTEFWTAFLKTHNADSDEVARAFRDDVARYSDMMSPGVRCLAGG